LILSENYEKVKMKVIKKEELPSHMNESCRTYKLLLVKMKVIKNEELPSFLPIYKQTEVCMCDMTHSTGNSEKFVCAT